MATLFYANQYITTTLSKIGGLNDSDTTDIVLASVAGIDISKPSIALLTYSDPIDTSKCEWISYTSINGSNELVGVTRNSEGFGSHAHNNGCAIAFPLSANHINNLLVAFQAEHNDDGTHKNSVSTNGWTSAGTFTYASADAPTYVITVASGAASIYGVGDRIKLTDSTVKYFIITAVADTSLTVYGGTDYTLSGGAISNPFYSHQKAPLGFPLSPTKWTVEVTDTTNRAQATPTNDVWYNPGSITTSIPIGVWQVSWYANLSFADASQIAAGMSLTLSTANNSQSDADFTANITQVTTSNISIPATKMKVLSLASKTSYYMNIMTPNTGVDNIYILGAAAKTVIRSVCAYL